MKLGFLTVNQGLYDLKVIASQGSHAKGKASMHGHGNRLARRRKVLSVVAQDSVEDIKTNVYLAVCLCLNGSLLGSGLIDGSLLGSDALRLCGRSGFSLGGSLLGLHGILPSSSLGFIASLNPASSLALCHRQFINLGLIRLLHGILSRFRRDGLCQGAGSTRGPHGKDQQCRHRGGNDPFSQGRPRAMLQGFAFVSFLHLSTPSTPRKRLHA